jgi:hypothetical protein
VHVERWVAPSGRERLLVRLDPPAAARFARAARLAVPRPPAAPRSYGSARRPERHPRFPDERRAWRRALVSSVDVDPVVELGDVEACFGSIGERALRAAARASGGDARPVLAVLREVWEEGPPGLPIGPAASSFLADAVLALADDDAGRAGVTPVRWVDDVAFIGSRDGVRRSVAAWSSALEALGLRAHEGKRRRPAGIVAVGAPSLAGGIERGIIRG